MGTAYVSAKCSQGTNKATITWDSNFNVTVTITSGSLAWRVRGRASDNDSQTYCSGGVGVKSGSFSNGVSGKTYIFQVYDTVEETYANSGTTGGNNASDTSDFTLTSDGDNGGNSGGGDTGKAYLLYINAGNGTSVEVRNMNGNYINNMSTVYSGDYIAIKCDANSGYTLSSFNVSGATYESDYNGYKLYIVTGNVYISSSAIQSGDSGGNTGGGSSSSNSGIYPTSGTQNGVTATFTIIGSTVTVRVSNTDLYWRINGTDIGGDNGTYYINENRYSSGSFTAEDSHAYAFQVYSNGYWSDGLIFYTNIGSGGGNTDDDDDDDDGDGGNTGDSGGGTGSGGGGSDGDTVTAGGVTAKVTWTTDGRTTVTITSLGGYNAGLYWRVKLAGASGNTGIQIPDTNSTSGSFNATDGETYIFQICPNGTWTNDGGNASKFTVDFSSGSGSGSDGGGSGGSTVESYRIFIQKGTGIKDLMVERIWSEYGNNMQLSNYDQIWGNDQFRITVEPLDGYIVDTYTIDGVSTNFYSDNLDCLNYSLNVWSSMYAGDIYISASATVSSTVHIYDGYEFSPYSCYIYNGVGWDLYTPFVYNGVEWDRYS